jgi:hypothetical protein
MKAEETINIRTLQSCASNAKAHKGGEALLRDEGILFRIRRNERGLLVQWARLIPWTDLALRRGGTNVYQMLRDAEAEIAAIVADDEAQKTAGNTT